MNDDTLRTADLWRTRGDAVALATVVRTRRSAPRPLGSKFAVGSRGEMAGSVSGGCVEGAVVHEAQSVLQGGPPKLVFYGIANDEAWDVGLACGGEIWVWIERYDGWETPAERAARVTVINGDHAGSHAFVTAVGATGEVPEELADAILAAVEEAISAERNQTVLLDDDGLIFAEALVPSPRVVVVGAVDTADALCRMAGALGWRTVVIDPRSAFATAERIPSANEIVVKWPEEGYDDIELRPEDHIVVLTHDPKLDDPAISGALRRGVGYVGALGSRRTQEKRRDRLRESGISDEQLARISGPVGLDIGAHTPEETAISILAEIIAVRAGREGGRLRDAKGRIHVVDEAAEAAGAAEPSR
ncbi:MAG: xanthine dehydrogenase accessory factor [Gaiellales bacterium]|nr:xanthine dehydrogenase accessory factor [Gaiellales bacterium]